MSSLIPEKAAAQKLFTVDTLRSAAKQSINCIVVPVRLRRAIKTFLRDREMVNMKRKVLRLTQSFRGIMDANRMLDTLASKQLVEDPLKSTMERSRRWKIKSGYGDIGLSYRDDETLAYVATRMPAVYSACFRVLSEVKRRVPNFYPASVLDFGSGAGAALWALKEVWPNSIKRVNLVEPSQPMQRAGQNLLVRDDAKSQGLPLFHSYSSLQLLSRDLSKPERGHDLVIASYVLGEIPSLKDRITTVRQLWNLTRDILVLVEPGTPEGSNIISQMRSHILWMEKRKCSKFHGNSSLNKPKASQCAPAEAPRDAGAFVLAPCPHDGPCPLHKAGKYCHFVQRLERTSTQRAYKRSKGGRALRGFEDEKFSYVALKRGKRSEESWPLDGMKFDTLKELHAKRDPADLEIDYEDQFESESEAYDLVPYEDDRYLYDSDVTEPDSIAASEEKEGNIESAEDKEDTEGARAHLGSGWGRIIFPLQKRGKRIEFDVCRATKRDGSEGSFDHVIVTQAKNPALHHQARRSLWGDLWPF